MHLKTSFYFFLKEKMTRESMNEELLNNLIRRSDRAYYEFVKSLRKTLQGHLADLLDESTRRQRTPKRKRQTGNLCKIESSKAFRKRIN